MKRLTLLALALVAQFAVAQPYFRDLPDVVSHADVFSVRAFGAVGDGTTDDAAALDAATTAAAARPGSAIYVPWTEGGYYRSTQWVIPSTVTLWAAPGVVFYFDSADFNDAACIVYDSTGLASTAGTRGIRGYPQIRQAGTADYTSDDYVALMIKGGTGLNFEIGNIINFPTGIKLYADADDDDDQQIGFNNIDAQRIFGATTGIELEVDRTGSNDVAWINSNRIYATEIKWAEGNRDSRAVRIRRDDTLTDDNIAKNIINITTVEGTSDSGEHIVAELYAGKLNEIRVGHVENADGVMRIVATEGDVYNNYVSLKEQLSTLVWIEELPTSDPGNDFYGNFVLSETDINPNSQWSSGDVFTKAYQSDGSTAIGIPGIAFKTNTTNAAVVDSSNLGTEALRVDMIGASGSVEGISQAAQGVVSMTGHPFVNGDLVVFEDVGGMVEVNENGYVVVGATSDTFALDAMDGTDVNTTGFTAYTSGGTARAVPRGVTGVIENGYIFLQSSSQIMGRFVDTTHHKTFNVSFAHGRPATPTGRIGIVAYNAAGTQFTPNAVSSQAWNVQAAGLITTAVYGDGWGLSASLASGAKTFTVSDNVKYVFVGMAAGPEFRSFTIGVHPSTIITQALRTWVPFPETPTLSATPANFGYYPLGWRGMDVTGTLTQVVATTGGFLVTATHMSSTSYTAGQSFIVNGGRVYMAVTTGMSSTTAPTHNTGGVVTDGGVGWLDLGPVAAFTTMTSVVETPSFFEHTANGDVYELAA